MEADEEERKLCAEILENWDTPTPISSEILQQNPFSRKWRWNSKEMIPVLVADTFYDNLLGHAADGIDIAALVDDDGPRPTTDVSPIQVQPNQIHNSGHLSSSCFNLSSQSTIPTKTAVPTEFSVCTQLDFVRKLAVMLYSNKTINTDDFGEKMWRNPGADTTDFFNYGLDEKQWKDYCKQMHALIHGPTKMKADTIEEGEIVE